MGNTVGENRSFPISEGGLLKLSAADHNRVLNDGTGLSGKVHSGSKGVSVHFRYRYRFQGEPREVALGAWPRVSLDAIRSKFDEIKLRVERGSDPAAQKQLVAQKIKLEQDQLAQQQRGLLERQREYTNQRLTLQAMFEAWYPEAMAEVKPRGALAVRRLFEMHLLPQIRGVHVVDVKPEHVRAPVRALINAGKVATAISLYVYVNAMFVWGGKRKPWRLLFEINPAEEVDLDRLLPPDYQSWCERVLDTEEIIELRVRFQIIRNAYESRCGTRRGLATPMRREHELAVWLMLATLARINEICAARWEHVDFAQKTWRIPATQTKNRKTFTICLSDFALRLVHELHELTGGTAFVLPYPRDNTKACSIAVLRSAIGGRQSVGKWKRKNRSSEVTARSLVLPGGPWSSHDMRRTGATLMQGLGIDEGIVDRCLNHSVSTRAAKKGINPHLLRTYQQYDYEREMRRAWQTLGEYLERLDGPLAQVNGSSGMLGTNDATVSPPQLDAA